MVGTGRPSAASGVVLRLVSYVVSSRGCVSYLVLCFKDPKLSGLKQQPFCLPPVGRWPCGLDPLRWLKKLRLSVWPSIPGRPHRVFTRRLRCVTDGTPDGQGPRPHTYHASLETVGISRGGFRGQLARRDPAPRLAAACWVWTCGQTLCRCAAHVGWGLSSALRSAGRPLGNGLTA